MIYIATLILYEYTTDRKKNQVFKNFLSLFTVLLRCAVCFYIHNMQKEASPITILTVKERI